MSKASSVDVVVHQSSTSSDVKLVEMQTRWRVKRYDVLLRSVGMLLTLIATLIVGVDKETKVISYAALQFTAKCVGVHVCYCAIARKNGNKSALLVVTLMDLVTAALLFSANGAGSAVGVLGEKGNTHVQWIKVCNVFYAYSRHMNVALVLSLPPPSFFCS